MNKRPAARDKLLFTPGPLSTSQSVRLAMTRDLGSRDAEFMEVTAGIRRGLLELLELSGDDYAAVPLQGCGSMGVEAALNTAIPRRGGKLLAAANGAYGRRLAETAERAGLPCLVIEGREEEPLNPAAIERALAADPDVTHVGAVHCETSTGVFNPIGEIGAAVRRQGRVLIVDAMSSLGGARIKAGEWNIGWLVSSANKCLESVPGLSLILAKKSELLKSGGNSRSLCLDLHDQHAYMEKTGQFRFTPPVQALLALRRALEELTAEGGVGAREARYRENSRILRRGMADIGFREYLAPENQGWIIISFRYPEDAGFSFAEFYRRLSEDGFLIYPGKAARADLFRIGCIGALGRAEMTALLAAVRGAVGGMGLRLSPLERPV